MTTELVKALVEQDPIPALLQPAQGWRRVYGRSDAHNGVLLIYEPDFGPNGAVCVKVEGGLTSAGMPEKLVAFPMWADARLPALAHLRSTREHIQAIRYRPGKRCTLRLGENTPFFVKCVADGRGETINAEARLLHNAQRAGMLGFSVPRPAGWLPGLRMMVQHRVDGRSIVPRIWHDMELAGRLGSANATLTAAPIRPSLRFDYADQMQRTAKYARRLQRLGGKASMLVDELMRRLGEITPGPADRPVHGAPHAHQWLEEAGRLALVDFDRFSLGDPELDVATFVAEADFEQAEGARSAASAYAAAFGACWPFNARLLQAYRTHKHIAKALRIATAIRIDARERAIEILDTARSLP